MKNTYIEKRTLDFHANHLFKARQSKAESVSEWIQKIQALGSKFREAALADCSDDERAGILVLSDKLRNICFVQGLYSDRIQTIVRSRNNEVFDEIAETALEEESAIISKFERYRGEGNTQIRCIHCGKTGHPSCKCFSKAKKDDRINNFSVKKHPQQKEVTCFNCGEKGHISRNCKRPRRQQNREGNNGDCNSGNGDRSSVRDRPTVSSVRVGTVREDRYEYLELNVDISETGKLRLLVDTGADISLLRSTKLIGSTEFEPENKVKLKGVDGSTIETFGTIRANITEGNLKFPFDFHLVNRQVDLVYDGIVGRDFLQKAQAKICYNSRTVTLMIEGV